MNQQSTRNALFLDEMGLGPQWTLRAAPVFEPAFEPALALATGEAAIALAMPAPIQTPMPAAIEATIEAAVPADEPVPAVSAQAIAAMDWTELAFAAASCTRCALCHGRSNAVFGRGARDAALIVLGNAPGSADESAGAPLSGVPGQLLDNMLLAIDAAAADVYVSNLVKCRPGAAVAPTPEQLLACRPYLERELALLTQARTLLVLGQPAARSLLGPAVPSAALRGTAHRWGALAVVATLHPEDVLKGQTQHLTAAMAEDKAKVWADLCLARSAHGAGI